MSKLPRKLALFLLIVILLIPIFSSIWQNIQKSVWDGSHHLTVVIDNGNLDIWSIEPSEKSVVFMSIPENTYVSVGSYGNYRAGALGKLSMLERGDGSLVREAIAETLSVPVDTVLIRKDEAKNAISLADTFEFILAGKDIRYSNLSFFDTIRLWFFSLQMNKASVREVDIAKSEAFVKTTLPDGKEGSTIDGQRFYEQGKEYFGDKAIKDEAMTIAILNSTNKEGAANRLAALLTTAGANVVYTAKSEKQTETQIFTKTKSYTSDKIAQITGGKQIFEKPKEERADILVILGGE